MSIMLDTNDSATGRQEGQLIANAVPNHVKPYVTPDVFENMQVPW